MIIRPPAVEPGFQLQIRLCRRDARASLGREVQLGQYFTLGLKILSRRYSDTAGPWRGQVWRIERKVDAKRCSTVFFLGHA